MSTAPSGNSGGHPSTADQVEHVLTAPWFVHDAILYAGSFLAFWLADTPVGGGWDAALAAAPVALSAVMRLILGKTA